MATRRSGKSVKPKPLRRKRIRVGVVGVDRGKVFAEQAVVNGMELVAICDIWKERLHTVAKELKVTAYTEFDKFLTHEMDAVILANYFHEHAPLAIKAMKAETDAEDGFESVEPWPKSIGGSSGYGDYGY